MIGSPVPRSNHNPICSECDWIRIRSRQNPSSRPAVGGRGVSVVRLQVKRKRSASASTRVPPAVDCGGRTGLQLYTVRYNQYRLDIDSISV